MKTATNYIDALKMMIEMPKSKITTEMHSAVHSLFLADEALNRGVSRGNDWEGSEDESNQLEIDHIEALNWFNSEYEKANQ